jgi:hypothetical protein
MRVSLLKATGRARTSGGQGNTVIRARGSGTRDTDGKHGLLNYRQTIQRVTLHQLPGVKQLVIIK